MDMEYMKLEFDAIKKQNQLLMTKIENQVILTTTHSYFYVIFKFYIMNIILKIFFHIMSNIMFLCIK